MTNPAAAYERTTPKVGDSERVRKTITVADQGLYSGICGNLHPLYVNEIHARSTEAGGRLAFELVLAQLASTALAEIGGPYRRIGAINLRFPAFTRIGETVAARAEVTAVKGGVVTCSIQGIRDEGKVVVCEGSAELVDVR